MYTRLSLGSGTRIHIELGILLAIRRWRRFRYYFPNSNNGSDLGICFLIHHVHLNRQIQMRILSGHIDYKIVAKRPSLRTELVHDTPQGPNIHFGAEPYPVIIHYFSGSVSRSSTSIQSRSSRAIPLAFGCKEKVGNHPCPVRGAI